MRGFKDRREAGRRLGAAMDSYRGRPNLVILGLPRGGVVPAAELAKALDAPMDVFVVRKLGVPGHPELAMDALASGNVRVLNRSVIQSMGITEDDIDSVTVAEQNELNRREKAYRDGAPPLGLAGRTAILTDDGLATGATMRAAVRAAKAREAARVVVAVPVAAPDSLAAIEAEADEVVCLMAPGLFQAVGQWYEQFEQLNDEEVRRLIARERCGDESTG